jgi:hypothetical protein
MVLLIGPSFEAVIPAEAGIQPITDFFGSSVFQQTARPGLTWFSQTRTEYQLVAP